MKRGGPLKRTPLRNTKRLERRAPLKMRGRNYNKLRLKNFGLKGGWIAIQPCDVCGKNWGQKSDPHHEPMLSRGGTKKGLVPLCRRHHIVRHQIGPTRFNVRYKTNLLERAAYFERKWRTVTCDM